MTTFRVVSLLFLVLAATGSVQARRMRGWTYQELLDESGLVVIGFMTLTHDTKERADLPEVRLPAVGVETSFHISAILKGDKAIKEMWFTITAC